MLSGKERVRLLLEFLDRRANPHKNRTFQHFMTMIEETKKKKADIKKATQNTLKFDLANAPPDPAANASPGRL